jgi:hypothetical protein
MENNSNPEEIRFYLSDVGSVFAPTFFLICDSRFEVFFESRAAADVDEDVSTLVFFDLPGSFRKALSFLGPSAGCTTTSSFPEPASFKSVHHCMLSDQAL